MDDDAVEPNSPISFNRTIRIAALPGEVRTAVEDDYHHFRVAIRHDGGTITGTNHQSIRIPYSLCDLAGDALAKLIGLPLSPATTIIGQIDARKQCTHQFDVAAYAIAAAARGTVSRRYDIHVPRTRGRTESRTARLFRDGQPCLIWQVENNQIMSPLSAAGVSLGSGFTAWAAREPDEEAAEAALILRRGIFLASGRHFSEPPPLTTWEPSGACWVQQPVRYREAIPNVGATIVTDASNEALTGEDESWLSGN